MSSSIIAQPDTRDLSPAQKVIVLSLRDYRECTEKEVVEQTALSRTAVHFNLADLVESGIVDRRPSLSGPQTFYFSLADEYADVAN